MFRNFKKIDNLVPTNDWIVLDSDPIIRQKSEKIPEDYELSEEENLLINRMIAYIDAAYQGLDEEYNIDPGVAIAAIQVGLLKRITYVHYKDPYIEKEMKYLMINPEITFRSARKSYLKNGEGCLSVKPSKEGIVPRFFEIKVKCYDFLTKQEIEFTANNYFAICLQHEIDHMDGILYYDKINLFDPKFKDEDWIEI